MHLNSHFRGGRVRENDDSRGLFFFGDRPDLLVKTITKAELRGLRRSVASMVEHVTAHARETLLPRYLGCFRVKCAVGFSATLLVLQNTSFPRNLDTHRIERVFELQGCSCSHRFVSERDYAGGCKTLRDLNFSTLGLDRQPSSCSIRSKPAREKNGEFSRADSAGCQTNGGICTGDEDLCAGFIGALARDVRWLETQHFVGFSLLVCFSTAKDTTILNSHAECEKSSSWKGKASLDFFKLAKNRLSEIQKVRETQVSHATSTYLFASAQVLTRDFLACSFRTNSINDW